MALTKSCTYHEVQDSQHKEVLNVLSNTSSGNNLKVCLEHISHRLLTCFSLTPFLKLVPAIFCFHQMIALQEL